MRAAHAPAMRPVLLAAACFAALCAPTAADGPSENAENIAPWVADPDREKAYYEMDEKAFSKFVKKVPVDSRKFHLFLFFTSPEDDYSKRCQGNLCTWQRETFKALAEEYHKELHSVNEQPYTGDGTPLYFVLLTCKVSKAEKAFAQMLRSNINNFSVLKAGSAFGENYQVSYAPPETAGTTKEHKARKESRGRWGYLKKEDSRRSRRARGLVTQETQESLSMKWSSYHQGTPGMKILCRWIKSTLGHEFWECPQDKASDVGQSEQKSQAGKHIIVAILGASAIWYLLRAFSIILPRVNPNDTDTIRSRARAIAIAELNDEHKTRHMAVPVAWQILTYIGWMVVTVFVSACASGMYFNYLRMGNMWGQGTPYSYKSVHGVNGAFEYTCVAVGGSVTLTSTLFIALGRAGTMSNGYTKLFAVFSLSIALLSCLAFMMNFVLTQRPSMRGTWLWDNVIHGLLDK